MRTFLLLIGLVAFSGLLGVTAAWIIVPANAPTEREQCLALGQGYRFVEANPFHYICLAPRTKS